MGRFKQKVNKQPEIPTAALPDIIFILLFFFMITTTMKENNPMVEAELPNATSVKKVSKEMQKITFTIGKAYDVGTYGTEPVIQVDDKIIQLDDINNIVSETLNKMKPEKRSVGNIVAYIKGDEELKMGLLNDVTQRLRKLGVLTVDYAATKGAE